MRMISYKALTGVEIQHWQGRIYFWMEWGVYSLKASTLHGHGEYQGPREVCFWLLDLVNGHVCMYTAIFDEECDDWEIINRYVSGTGACDCVRGQMLYGDKTHFECNKKDNRFIIQKMVIKGNALNCVVFYRGYI